MLQEEGNEVKFTMPGTDIYHAVSIIKVFAGGAVDRPVEENGKFIIRSMHMYKCSISLCK